MMATCPPPPNHTKPISTGWLRRSSSTTIAALTGQVLVIQAMPSCPYTAGNPGSGHGRLQAADFGAVQQVVCANRKLASSHCLTDGLLLNAATIWAHAAQHHSVCSWATNGTESI